jgi:hypothetical protein
MASVLKMSDASPYITTFPQDRFAAAMWNFFVPSLLLGLVSSFVLSRTFWRLDFIPALFVGSSWTWVRDPEQFEKWIPWLVTSALLVFHLAIALFIAFAAVLMATTNTMIGVTALLVGFTIITALYAFFSSKASAFRDFTVNAVVEIGQKVVKAQYQRILMMLRVSGLCWLAFSLWVIFGVKPYSFIGISAVFLSLHLIPTAELVFLAMNGSLKEISEYPGMEPPLYFPGDAQPSPSLHYLPPPQPQATNEGNAQVAATHPENMELSSQRRHCLLLMLYALIILIAYIVVVAILIPSAVAPAALACAAIVFVGIRL